MDSFEINKIVAAVLMVVLLVIGIGKVSDAIFHVEKPKTPGYAVDDDAAVHFLGKDVHKVISSRENPGAYYVQKVGSNVIETPLDTTILD